MLCVTITTIMITTLCAICVLNFAGNSRDQTPANWVLIGANPQYQLKTAKQKFVVEGTNTTANVYIVDPDVFMDIAHPFQDGTFPFRYEQRWKVDCQKLDEIILPGELKMTLLSTNPNNTTGVVTITPPLATSGTTTIPLTSVCSGAGDTYNISLQACLIPVGDPGPVAAEITFVLTDTGPLGHPKPNAIANAKDGVYFIDPETGLPDYTSTSVTFGYVVTKPNPGPQH